MPAADASMDAASRPPDSMQARFGSIRSASWLVLGLTAVVMAATMLLNNAVILQHDPTPEFVVAMFRATGGLIRGTLIASLVTLIATAIVIFGLGRLRGWDVGWRLPELCWGVVVTLAFWITMQGVLAVVAAIDGHVSLHAAWKQRGASVVIGALVAQLFGNALAEETLMRGFFLPQFYLKAVRTFRRGTALMIAVAGSTLLFAVLHLPNRFWVRNFSGMEVVLDQAGLLAFGLLASAIFLVTRNLFIAIGLHALINEPAAVVDAAEITVAAVWFGLTVLLLVTWPLLNRLLGVPGTIKDPRTA